MKSILEKGSKAHGCRSRSIVLINVPQLRISKLISNVAHVALAASPLVIFELSELSICGFAPLCTCIGADFSVEARSGTGLLPVGESLCRMDALRRLIRGSIQYLNGGRVRIRGLRTLLLPQKGPFFRGDEHQFRPFIHNQY